jgi:hypothetical protein
MVDKGFATADAATLKEMQKHSMSCKLEHMFWDQANACMQWPDIVGRKSTISKKDYDSSVDY